MTTEHEVEINQPIVITATLFPQYIKSKTQNKSPTKFTDMDNFNTVSFSKDVSLGDNNIQSNFIPKLVDEGNVLTNEQLEKLEDERHMQHKMFHEEIARVGNVDNIFSQPTDHFIPPLVMAKSRMIDDMTVLSLAEKHAQQIAEKQFSKHSQIDHSYIESNNNKLLSDKTHMDKPLITSIKLNKVKETKLNILKSHVPKKYVNEKYYEPKGKIAKIGQLKPSEIITDTTQIPTTIQEDIKTISSSGQSHQDKIDDDFAMDLTIMLKEAPFISEEKLSPSNYTSDVVKLETITNNTMSNINKFNNSETQQENSSILPNIKNVDKNTMEHEVIKITVISNDDPRENTSVFEITTKMPIFRDTTEKGNTYSTPLSTIALKEIENTEDIKQFKSEGTSKADNEVSTSEPTTFPVIFSTTTGTEDPITLNVTTVHVTTTTEIFTEKAEELTTITHVFINKTEMPTTISTTTVFYNISDEVTDVIYKTDTDNLPTDNHNDSTAVESNVSLEKLHFDNAEVHDDLQKNMNDTDEIVDDDSPILSGAYEPMHRPPRTRRPQQQNRKFNPFRILG